MSIYLGLETYNNISYLINKRGDISVMYKVTFPAVFTFENEKFDAIQSSISRAISSLPIHCNMQRLDFVYKEQNTYNEKNYDTLEKQEKEYFNNTSFKKIETFFIFTSVAEPNEKKGYFSNLLETTKNTNKLLKKDHYSDSELNNFQIVHENFMNIYAQSFEGLLQYNLLNADAIKLVTEGYYFNLDFMESKKFSIKNEILDREEYVKSGNKTAYVLSMEKLPKNIYSCLSNSDFKPNFSLKETNIDGNVVEKQLWLPVSQLYNLYFQLEEDLIISTIIYPKNQRKSYEDVQSKAKQLRNFAFGDLKNMIAADNMTYFERYLAENKDDTIQEIHQSYIVVCSSEDELTRSRTLNNIKNVLNKIEIEVGLNISKPLRIMVSNAPGNGSDVANDDRLMCTSSIASKMQLIEQSSKTESPLGIPFQDCVTNELIQFDINKYTTKHFAIFGPTGTGKSFLTNHILKHLMLNGEQVIISDIGYSYQDQCEYWGGNYIELSEQNPLKMNPFLNFKKDNSGQFLINFEDEQVNEIMDFTTELFGICYKGTDSSYLTTSERAFIKQLISNYLIVCNKENRRPTFDDFYNNLSKLVEEDENLSNIENSTFSLNNFKLIMQVFTSEGQYGNIFNTDENTNLGNNQLVIFELEKLQKNYTLFPITYFILTNLVLQKMYNKERLKSGKGFYFILDEIHILLNDKYGNTAPFLEYCIRTFRKWGAGFGMATQNLSDLYKNKNLQDAIINNMALMYFKKQKQEQASILQKLLSMNENNLTKLFSISEKNQYTDLFIYDNNGRGNLFKLNVSRFSYWLYTTNPKDKAIKLKAIEKYGTLKLAIQKIIELEKKQKN